MERSALESTALLSAGYDRESGLLEIEFTSGRVYQFESVPEAVYSWLLRVPNKGSYVARMINGRYRFRDVTAAPAEPDLLAQLRDSVRWLEDKDRG